MKILLVEDDAILRKGIRVFLTREGHEVVEAENGKHAFILLKKDPVDLIVSDVMMPEMDGLDLLKHVHAYRPQLPILMMTAYASVKDAVFAVKNGAEDYLTKPLDLQELKIKISKIEEKTALLAENSDLKEKIKRLEFSEMVGTSPPMRALKEMIRRVAADPTLPVMINGESGSGKELVARAIHSFSERAANPFVAVNCAAFPEELLESELFGYKKGAFTGANHDKPGYFQEADKGTLFLDEIGDMSAKMQARLLRVLQEKTIQVLGSTKTQRIDVRIIGASNKKLNDLVEQGIFREDLFYRLNVIELKVPALREHPEDIPLLIDYFVKQKEEVSGKKLFFSSQTIEMLQSYSWPGNVRELINLLRQLQITCISEQVLPTDIPLKIRQSKPFDAKYFSDESFPSDYKRALKGAIQTFDFNFLNNQLKLNKGNISKTAKAIGLSRVALHKKINDLGIPMKRES